MRITLDQLEVLEAIAAAGSFSAAARKLRRATSAVSYAVRALEEALGVEIFDRAGHRAVLTDQGTAVLAAARPVVAGARDLERLGAELKQGWEPRLTLVADGILPVPSLIRAVQRLAADRLPTKVRLHIDFLAGVGERFAREDAELMVTLGAAPGLCSRPLAPVEMLLLAHRAHPLFAASGPRSRAALAEHVELLVAASAGRAMPEAERLFIGGPQVLEVPDFHAKRDALLAGVGFGWLPRHLAAEALGRGDLVPVGFDEGDVHAFRPVLAWRPDRRLGPGARRLAGYIEEELGPAPGA